MKLNSYITFKGNCEDAFWGGKFGMLTDRFGIQWMVSSEHKPA